MISRRTVARWALWGTVLSLVTALLVLVRQPTEQTYVPLTYLLVVLGGSAGGGRKLGFTLACVSFGLIDYFLQPPYDDFLIGKTIDGVTLISFFATAGVATQLLDRARRERDEAVNRADELTAISRLGSESLSTARADDAVSTVASMIRVELGLDDCAILPTTTDPPPAEQVDGVIAVPLHVHDRRVGTMLLRTGRSPRLSRGRAFLEAVSYYAALALERARLASEAEYASSLREANRMKDFVLASVSHDLRTPLTSLKALAQDELRTGVSHAAEIDQQADRLTRMVTDLLDLSRLRSGGFAVTPELNAAEDVVGAAMRQCEPLAGGRRLVAPLDETAPALYGTFDFVHTLRILVNLLENALRLSPIDGEVELTARRDRDDLVFAVADRGPGIPVAERDRVFEAFYRPAGSLPDRGRAGLGLAIARSLAGAQGGSLVHHPRPGGGSVFELRLPAADVDVGSLVEHPG